MKIAEIYLSIQGEGQWTGVESVFVRTSGCNLRCWFCDTPFTSWAPEGEDLSLEDIVARVRVFECEHVVLTGGEPMLYAELVPLAARLRELGLKITIETAGTLYLEIPCDLMSISPKLANSTPNPLEHPRWSLRHEHTRHTPKVVSRLMAEHPSHQLKFVVNNLADCREVESYLDELENVDRGHVWLMPQGTEAEELNRQAVWLKAYCQRAGLHFCPRRHIEWFGLLRGT
jgi:7-carboxy-7-deazaguanine synthase